LIAGAINPLKRPPSVSHRTPVSDAGVFVRDFFT
jgi:hypothetical protein